jgi:integrase
VADADPVPAKVVADRLGHSSVLVTLDRYSRVNDEDRKAAADLGSRMVGS